MTTALPSNISFGTVTGRFSTATLTSGDADGYPNLTPATGLQITFTAATASVLDKTASPSPVTIEMVPIVCSVDTAGYLMGGDGTRGVKLIASTDPDLDPHGWTWHVTFTRNGTKPAAFRDFNMTIDSGQTYDITLVAPVPSATGVSLSQAQAAELAAVAAGSAASASALAAAESALLAGASALSADAAAGSASATAAALPDSITAAVVAQDIPGQIAAQNIPGQVAVAVSAAPAVTTAAANAVGAALVDANLLSAPTISPGAQDDVAFTIVGASGERSWVEIGNDGHPTAQAVSQLNTALAPAISTAATTAAALTGTAVINDGVGTAFAIVDSAGRTALSVKDDGTVNIYKPGVGGVADGSIGLTQLTPSLAASIPAVKIASGPDIICWGDSLTAGSGGTVGQPNYPEQVALLSGRTVRNGGVGGETSTTIAARQGGNPFSVLVTGGTIPASGGVTVTFGLKNGFLPAPLLQGTGTPGSSFIGLLAGVEGTISYDSGTTAYTFTRTVPGSDVTCDRPTPFYLTFAEARRGDIACIWVGQNNGGNDATRAIPDAWAMIQRLNTLDKRWLVLSKPSSNDAVDSTYYQEFGRRFVAVRQYLVAYGLQDAGLTATSQDTIDIGNGTIPTSLRSDVTHLNYYGYAVLGTHVYKRLLEMGWV